MRHLIGSALALIGCVLLPMNAQAKFCGDDLGGVRVACDCGDVVASDTVLQSTDPVVGRRCPFDGLVIRADALADTITLNLNGLTLVGQNRGVGVMIQRGGSDGAAIVGGDAPRMGDVVGFEIGVLSPNPRTLRRLERVTAKGNRRDGFWLRQAGAVVLDAAAERNGGSGFRISGTGGRFEGLRADGNGGRGIVVDAPGATVAGAAIANRLHGVVSASDRTKLESVEARDNGKLGVALRRAGSDRRGIRASGNRGGDVSEPRSATRRGAR
jgi:hypothetical protein